MIKKIIGERIKLLRKQNKLTQEEFSKKIELDRTYLSRVESGKQNITIESLKQICDGLDISLNDFFCSIHDL